MGSFRDRGARSTRRRKLEVTLHVSEKSPKGKNVVGLQQPKIFPDTCCARRRFVLRQAFFPPGFSRWHSLVKKWCATGTKLQASRTDPTVLQDLQSGDLDSRCRSDDLADRRLRRSRDRRYAAHCRRRYGRSRTVNFGVLITATLLPAHSPTTLTSISMLPVMSMMLAAPSRVHVSGIGISRLMMSLCVSMIATTTLSVVAMVPLVSTMTRFRF